MLSGLLRLDDNIRITCGGARDVGPLLFSFYRPDELTLPDSMMTRSSLVVKTLPRSFGAFCRPSPAPTPGSSNHVFRSDPARGRFQFKRPGRSSCTPLPDPLPDHRPHGSSLPSPSLGSRYVTVCHGINRNAPLRLILFGSDDAGLRICVDKKRLLPSNPQSIYKKCRFWFFRPRVCCMPRTYLDNNHASGPTCKLYPSLPSLPPSRWRQTHSRSVPGIPLTVEGNSR
jgi:hypothetical protein